MLIFAFQSAVSTCQVVSAAESRWLALSTLTQRYSFWMILSALSIVTVCFERVDAFIDLMLISASLTVSAHLLQECLLDLVKDRTRVLVTHHFEAARHADLILVMENGCIVAQGTFSSIQDDPIFRTLGTEHDETKEEKPKQVVPTEKATSDVTETKEGDPSGEVTKIHLDEERNTGAITWAVYTAYIKAMSPGGFLAVAAISLLAAECSQVGNVLFLGFWSASTIPGFDKGHYMGIYAALGVSLGLFTFTGVYTACLAGIRASYLMFTRALRGVLRSPVAFHDRTPSGRIQSRLVGVATSWIVD